MSPELAAMRKLEAAGHSPDWLAMIEAIPLPCWIHQLTTDRLLAANAAAVELYGFSREEFSGMTLQSLAVAEDPDRTLGAEIQEIERDVVRHRSSDGKDIWVSIVSREPMKRGDDFHCMIAIDMTGKREIFETVRLQEVQLRKLINGSPDIIYEADARGYFTFVNPTALTVLGYEPQSLVGRHYSEIIREDWKSDVIQYYRTGFFL